MEWQAQEILGLLRNAAQNSNLFNEQSVSWLMETGKIVKMPAKSKLMPRNARISTVFVPLSAPIFGYLDDGGRDLHSLYEIGDFVGLPFGLTHSPYPFFLMTKEETDLLVVPFAHIRSMIDHDPSIRWHIINYIAHNLISDVNAGSRIMLSDPSARLAGVFVELAKNYGVTDGKVTRIEYKISQDEIGERIGTSRQTVNKYIQEFVENGQIIKKGHRYTIADLQALKSMAKIQE